MLPTTRLSIVVALSLGAAACSSDSLGVIGMPSGSSDISYAAIGSISAPSGKGSFRFGASSAATQIEDQNTHTDWYAWTDPAGTLAKGTFVGDASKGYTMAIEDVKLLSALHVDSYRFSIEWARIEPEKGVIDEAALDHYSQLIDALRAAGIRPNVTLHHFSNPLWVADPNDSACADGPTDKNLCGLDHPTGGPMIVKAMADHARLLAERFGDRVDEWSTLNEPINYLLAAYGAGIYPPGKFGLNDFQNIFIPALRNYLAAHAAMYAAIKAADTKDADGDGVAANVGLTKEAIEWVAARGGMASSLPADMKARDRVLWVYQYLFVEALRQGGLDTDLDGILDEPHPEWKDTLDWLGVQYYTRAGVTASPGLFPLVDLTPCFGGFGANTACIPPLDPTYTVPAMSYEHDPGGLSIVLEDFAQRWPDLPLTVTESGIATHVGDRRTEIAVRELEQIEKARAAGADVRGYYHWSVIDNFEWALGFTPRFGLFSVDYTTYARTPTSTVDVLADIASHRLLAGSVRAKFGGDGPLTPEPASDAGGP